MGEKKGPWKPPVKKIPIDHWKIFLNDKVQVIGGKAKGQTGVVIHRDKDKMTVTVQNCNMKKRAYRHEFSDGSHVWRMRKMERPIHYSDVALLDPQDKKPCKVVFRRTPRGKRVRLSKRSGAVVPRIGTPRKEEKEKPEVLWSDRTTMTEHVLQCTYVFSELPQDPRLGIPNKKARRTEFYAQLPENVSQEPLPTAQLPSQV